MKYKGIISDPDGVICSADEDHYPALKTPADRLNISFGGERNNQLRGVSRAASLNIIPERTGLRDLFDAAACGFDCAAAGRAGLQLSRFPDIIKCLN